MDHGSLPTGGRRSSEAAGGDTLSVPGPQWREIFARKEIAPIRAAEFQPLTVVHYETAASKAPAHIRSDHGAFAAWRLTGDSEIQRRVKFGNEWRLPYEDAQRLFDSFSSAVRELPVHKRIDKAGGLNNRDGCAEFASRYPADTDVQAAAGYDSRWMERMFADAYTFYLMRRENRETFVNPHLAPDPIGVLLRQGYVLNPHPKDLDVVLYCSQPKAHGYVESQHWGVFHDGGVISKNTNGNVMYHTLDAGGYPGQSVLFFTKPFVAAAPVADLYGITDWALRGPAVVSRSNQERADQDDARKRRVRELEDGLLAASCFGH